MRDHRTLYGHQEDDLLRLRTAMSEPAASVLYVAFMGSGKTLVAARLISEWVESGERVLVLTNRRVLVGQTDRRLRDADLTSEQIGWIWRKHPRTDGAAPVQLASIDTLIRREAPIGISRIVIDEAHHVAAGKWQTVLSWYPGVRRLGLTATPERLDGKPLGEFFEVMIESAPVSELIEAGTVRKPEVWTRPDALVPNMRGVRRRGADWAKEDAARAMATLVGDIPAHWLKHADGRPTVGFAPTLKQARVNVKRFRMAGIKSELLCGMTKDDKREAILERLRGGKTSVVWTCDTLSEGWDYPGARCAILARPTSSLTRYLQWCGRVMRAGSVMPVILDHAGNYAVHGMPYRVQHWDLHASHSAQRATVVVDRDGAVRNMTPTEVDGVLAKVNETRGIARQRECVGPDGTGCPQHRTPSPKAFCPSTVRMRNGAPWRCGRCAMSIWAKKQPKELFRQLGLASGAAAKDKWAMMSKKQQADYAKAISLAMQRKQDGGRDNGGAR